MCTLRRQRDWVRKRRKEDPTRTLLMGARVRAKQAGVDCTLTLDDLRELYPKDGRCPVLGIPLSVGKNGRMHDGSATLDRLNNEWGYERGNVAIISYRANRAKGTLQAHELEAIAAWMRRQGLG
jgi:hypothetical protein